MSPCVDAKPINLILPHVYLDSNVLVAAILEFELPLSSNDARTNFVRSSKELLDKWEPTALHTSNYAIGEFIARGRSKPFSKSYREMLDKVKDKILSKCQIIEGQLEKESEVLQLSEWPQEWMLAEVKFKGEVENARGDKNKLDYKILLTTSGTTSISRSGGVPLEYLVKYLRGEPYYTLTKTESFSYVAPAFEILLFNKASELAIKYGIPFGDALHLVYLGQEKSITDLVTDDEDFHSKRTVLPVKVVRPNDLLIEFKKYM